jgi:F-type H+-transporting ATPase subunit epsilon
MAEKRLQCVVVTPERTVLDRPADYVAIPLYDGELGVLPGRAPLIGKLGCGDLRVLHGETTEHFYIDGGFAQVRENVVTLLTPLAVKAAELNQTTIKEKMLAAEKPAATSEDRQKQQEVIEKGRVQLRVAAKAPKVY